LRDLQRAAMLFRESSADGFVPSMHALGLLLVNYPEIGRSHQEALHALCDAASAGMWKSSVILGLLARDGKWMPKDPAVAYFYLRVAESQGGSSATQVVENEIDKLSKLLHPDQFIQIDEHARTWARMHNVSLIRIYRNRGKQKHFPLYGQVTAIDGVHAGALMPSRPPAASKQNYSDLAATPNCSAINLAQNDVVTRSVYGTQID
ncbi:MAG TPA: hypothetical protein VHD85_08550, partial [Terracidiphilus sp.]|nr:hypothetical protein [Terracidiphilus sp.]